MDCKVIPGECVVSQHKLVVADFRFLVQACGNKQARVENEVVEIRRGGIKGL